MRRLTCCDAKFLLRAHSAEKATTVASFTSDYRYEVATAQKLDDSPASWCSPYDH